jgi:hypothetical protein
VELMAYFLEKVRDSSKNSRDDGGEA